MVINDDFYLQLALDEAWKYQVLTYPNPAVGCAVVDKNGRLLSVEAHKEAGSAHAELEAAKKALSKLGLKLTFPKNPNELHAFILAHHANLLKDAVFYVSLEPCSHQGKTPSCAMLLKNLGIKKVVIGSVDETPKASGGAMMLKNAGVEVIWSGLKEQSKALIEPFNQWQKGSFVFFKLALSKNGVISGGLISNDKSRFLVHRLRDKCDLLVIGGNTVRVDRPTLDARLCKGKAPDVLVYSRKKNFDANIPLFKVPNRKVFVEEDFSRLKDYKCIMVEGGEGMLKDLPKEIRHFLLFQSSHFKNADNISLELDLKPLWQGQMDDDSYAWCERM